MSIKCEMTLNKEVARDYEYETDSDHENSEAEAMLSPYSSKPLPDLSEAELSAAKELREWLAQISDPKTNVIQKLFDAESYDDNDEDIIRYDEREKEIHKIIGERNAQGRLDGECEIFYKNGDYFWGHFVDGIKHGNKDQVSPNPLTECVAGEASVVLGNGDHTLGHYEGGRLHGVVREEEEGGLVTREVTHIRGRRQGAWREWRAGELNCVASEGHMWTRTRSKELE